MDRKSTESMMNFEIELQTPLRMDSLSDFLMTEYECFGIEPCLFRSYAINERWFYDDESVVNLNCKRPFANCETNCKRQKRSVSLFFF